MALTLNEMNSTTQDYWLPGAKDQYYSGNVLMYTLLRKQKKVNGGVKIRQVLHYGSPKGGAFGENTEFNTSRYDDHNAARFDWAYYYEPVTYGMQDKVENTGEAQEIDVVHNKLNMAQKAIKQNMADDLYDSLSQGSEKPLTGLLSMINSTSSTAYGEIAEDDMSEWAPGHLVTAAASLTLAVMRTIRRNCKVGDEPTDIPSLYVTTDALLDTYKALLQPQQRFSDPKYADAGFQTEGFEGKPVVSDQRAPSGYMFALNESYMDMVSHTDFHFKHEPWMRPTNQYKFTMQIMWVGNLVCMRRDAHGYQSGLS
jgi:hypothetical protein